MLFVFVSNFYSSHQDSFSRAMDKITNNNYFFIETDGTSEMGWKLVNKPDYVIDFYDDHSKGHCFELINNADVVVIGSAPHYLVKNRLNKKLLTFRYSERIFKSKLKWHELPARILLYYYRYGRYKNFYLLCAGAYVAGD